MGSIQGEVSSKDELWKTMSTSATHVDITAHGEVPSGQTPGLAMSASVERNCADAQAVLDPEFIERFCQVWAEVGRAILLRREQRK